MNISLVHDNFSKIKSNFIIMAYQVKGLTNENAKLQKKIEKQLPQVNRGRIKFIVFSFSHY